MQHNASRLWLALIVCFAVALCAIGFPYAVAQGPSQVGLVVRFGDDSVIVRCIALHEPEVSGYEVLTRSGLRVIAAPSGGMGAAICQIEEEGCPASNCFCRCQGATCDYWSYWHLEGGEWVYSGQGANISRVRSGDVQGWSWGQEPPPTVSLEEICVPSPPATATATATSTDIPVFPTPAPTQTSGPVTPTPSPTLAATGTPRAAGPSRAAPTLMPKDTPTPPPVASAAAADTPTAVAATATSPSSTPQELVSPSPTPAMELRPTMAATEAQAPGISQNYLFLGLIVVALAGAFVVVLRRK